MCTKIQNLPKKKKSRRASFSLSGAILLKCVNDLRQLLDDERVVSLLHAAGFLP